MYREETLLNVIKSVTRNGRSIVLTAVLALILVYLFSIVGYIFFKDDFILEVDHVPNATRSKRRFLSLVFFSAEYFSRCIEDQCIISSYFLENGGSLTSEFLPAGMCHGGIDENCTTGVPQEGTLHWVPRWFGLKNMYGHSTKWAPFPCCNSPKPK